MKAHGRVSRLNGIGDGVYELTLGSGRVLKVFICECYSYGAAEYVETIQNLGKLDAIIINSNWCGYTTEAKLLCRSEKVGLFDIGDFMGALNKPEIWSYLNEHDLELFKEKGWL
jgi:hypothetical protein